MDGRILIVKVPLRSNEKSDKYMLAMYKLYGLLCTSRTEETMHYVFGSGLSIGPSVRVSDGLSRFRGVISGRTQSKFGLNLNSSISFHPTM